LRLLTQLLFKLYTPPRSTIIAEELADTEDGIREVDKNIFCWYVAKGLERVEVVETYKLAGEVGYECITDERNFFRVLRIRVGGDSLGGVSWSASVETWYKDETALIC
jgi:hypothetical protein